MSGIMYETFLSSGKERSYAVPKEPEIDPAFTDLTFLLADRRDGQPLDQFEGKLRIVVPHEKRHARWVRQVVALSIRR